MKKIITALALSVAMISPSMAAMTPTEKDDFCDAVKGLAEATMKNRLSGVDVADQMKAANNLSGSSRILAREMVVKAYSGYGYKTDEYKKSAVTDFGATYYLDCMRHSK